MCINAQTKADLLTAAQESLAVPPSTIFLMNTLCTFRFHNGTTNTPLSNFLNTHPNYTRLEIAQDYMQCIMHGLSYYERM